MTTSVIRAALVLIGAGLACLIAAMLVWGAHQAALRAFVVLFLASPVAMALALWSMRRGLARAGFLGVLARALGGAAILVAAGYLAGWSLVPGVKRDIAACEAEQLTATRLLDCESLGLDVGVVWVLFMLAAVAWAAAVVAVKAAVLGWRLLRRAPAS